VLNRPYGKPDYILLSTREIDNIRSALIASFASHEYQLVGSGFDEFYLFSRGSETAATASALGRLGLETAHKG
jgi:ATP phosphoribosyltransferase regulatory subunit HisZ